MTTRAHVGKDAVRPVPLAAVLQAVDAFVQRFVVVTADQAVTVALWIAHTHVIGAFDCTPYLQVTSATKRAGKTRLLEVIEPLVARPWLTQRVSAAALVRKVDAVHPTLLLDESDAAFKGDKEYAEALRGAMRLSTLGQGDDLSVRARRSARTPPSVPKRSRGLAICRTRSPPSFDISDVAHGVDTHEIRVGFRSVMMNLRRASAKRRISIQPRGNMHSHAGGQARMAAAPLRSHRVACLEPAIGLSPMIQPACFSCGK
jgi:hypothetical protein